VCYGTVPFAVRSIIIYCCAWCVRVDRSNESNASIVQTAGNFQLVNIEFIAVHALLLAVRRCAIKMLQLLLMDLHHQYFTQTNQICNVKYLVYLRFGAELSAIGRKISLQGLAIGQLS
jgi:hypothetical protein